MNKFTPIWLVCALGSLTACPIIIKKSHRSAATNNFLEFTSPEDGLTTMQDHIYAAGGCSSSIRELASANALFVDDNCKDGTFILGPISLALGANKISVSGTDDKGVAYTAELTVHRVEQDISFPEIALVTPTSGVLTKTNVVEQIIEGTCSHQLLDIQVNDGFNARIDNRCDGTGRFSVRVALPADGAHTVLITAKFLGRETPALAIAYVLDTVPPEVAFVSPDGESTFVTDDKDVTIAGTCSSDTSQISITSPFQLIDADCSDGTWEARADDLPVQQYFVNVTVKDAAANEFQASLSIVKMVVIGQPNATSNVQLERGDLYTPVGVWTDGTKLAIADTYNHRVLIYNNLPANTGIAPDIVLGQPDAKTAWPNHPELNAKSMNAPTAVVYAGGKFFVADSANHRVLVWNAWPTENGQAADVVLGQPNVGVNTSNNGGISASSLNFPTGLASDGSILAVADSSNHRVLIWDAIPTTNHAAAANVVGQANFISSGASAGGATKGLTNPRGLALDNNKLWVADFGQNRIAVYDVSTLSDYPTVSFALGQPNNGSVAPNINGISASSMFMPSGVNIAGGRLYVADTQNHRTLIWNTVPAVSGVAADVVLGQANMTSLVQLTDGDVTLASMNFPTGVSATGSHVFVADAANHRLLRFNVGALSDGASAATFLGRLTGTYGMATSNLANVFAPFGIFSLNDPSAIAVTDSGKTIVADTNNHRVLIYDQFPKMPFDKPSVVLGQPNIHHITFNNDSSGISCRTMRTPNGVYFDGVRLYVADSGNNRVLVWDSLPTNDYTPADFVLGQPNCTSATANNATLTQPGARMSSPRMVAAHREGGATKLIVSDSNNNRVLVWNDIPALADTAPSAILGQAANNVFTANTGGISLARLSQPRGVATDGTRIAVTDVNNHRVLFWDSWPSGFAQAADRQIGQVNGTTAGGAHRGGVAAANTFNSPLSVSVYDNGQGSLHVAIVESGSNRVMVWNQWPSSENQSADRVFGQVDFTKTAAVNEYESGLTSPFGVHISAEGLAVTSTGGTDKLMMWRSLTAPSGSAADWMSYGGVSDTFSNGDRRVRRLDDLSASSPHCQNSILGGGRFACVDYSANRILLWNTIPVSNQVPADLVLGQDDFTSSSHWGGKAVPDGTTLAGPRGGWTDGARLVVSDAENRRILIWNSWPTVDNQSADIVLGQSALTNIDLRGSQLDASTFGPGMLKVTSDGTRLVVSSTARILLWNQFPTVDHQPADLVLGQPDFTTNIVHDHPDRMRTFYLVSDLLMDQEQLYVAITHPTPRVLIWKQWPTQNFQSADISLGSRPSSYTGYAGPYLRVWPTLAKWGQRLIVGDWEVNRVVTWDSPTSTDQPPDTLWGQKDWGASKSHSLSLQTMKGPRIAGDGVLIAILSEFEDRVILAPASWIGGQP